MRLTLRDVGLPYQKVMQGRTMVGRTYKAADGTYTCAIGGVVQYTGAASHAGAFKEGAARYFGAASAADLAATNAATRRRNAQRKRFARDLAEGMLSRDPATRNAAFDAFFGRDQ